MCSVWASRLVQLWRDQRDDHPLGPGEEKLRALQLGGAQLETVWACSTGRNWPSSRENCIARTLAMVEQEIRRQKLGPQ